MMGMQYINALPPNYRMPGLLSINPNHCSIRMQSLSHALQVLGLKPSQNGNAIRSFLWGAGVGVTVMFGSGQGTNVEFGYHPITEKPYLHRSEVRTVIGWSAEVGQQEV